MYGYILCWMCGLSFGILVSVYSLRGKQKKIAEISEKLLLDSIDALESKKNFISEQSRVLELLKSVIKNSNETNNFFYERINYFIFRFSELEKIIKKSKFKVIDGSESDK